jgi:transcription-repair coupling factor (superfamily II helicase)
MLDQQFLQLLEILEDKQRRPISLAQTDPQEIGFLILQLRLLLERLGIEKPILLVAPTQEEAKVIYENLYFYLKDAKLLHEVPSHYGRFSSPKKEIGENLSYLMGFAKKDPVFQDFSQLLCLSAYTWRKKLMPFSVLKEKYLLIQKGLNLSYQNMINRLQDYGYQAVSTVLDPCTYAIRGDIIDLYPPQLINPIRVHFWGDEIEQIDEFLAISQRKINDHLKQKFLITPVREYFFEDQMLYRAIDGIDALCKKYYFPKEQTQALFKDLENHLPFVGIEGVSPLFYENGFDTIENYFEQEPIVLFLEPKRIKQTIEDDLFKQLELYQDDQREKQLVLEPSAYYRDLEELEPLMIQGIHLENLYIGEMDQLPINRHVFPHLEHQLILRQALESTKTHPDPFLVLKQTLNRLQEDKYTTILVYHHKNQKDRLKRILHDYPMEEIEMSFEDLIRAREQDAMAQSNKIFLMSGRLSYGWLSPIYRLSLITAGEILNYAFTSNPNDTTLVGNEEENIGLSSVFYQNVRELKPGDYVVHLDHGIGQFIGMQRMRFEGEEHDMIELKYGDDSTLCLTVNLLNQLQKFVGPHDYTPKLTKLGSKTWTKIKEKAQEDTEEKALQFLELYAKRASLTGHQFKSPDDAYQAFEARFPYKETRDQLNAIRDVIQDMCSSKPMDRLVCGDVGFGKTEVAMRAAMKAVLDGKQVAVLVPTAVLAAQHEKTFKQRFTDTPFRIEQYSRFVTGVKQKELLQDLKNHDIDIIIGTHALLGKTVKFADLGLLILDEEHKFGVSHKEKLKEMKHNLDVLAMTATPIPRTLQMSLSGIRDMSVIRTPPTQRLGIQTTLARSSNSLVREKIIKELQRGGQVFFIHNRIDDLLSKQAWLTELVPEARVAIAHGELDDDELEEVIFKFAQGAYNVLLSTTIVGTGIDIPKANTMFVNNAHCFGLAQLHQLRGRVGRGNERAECILLVPLENSITKEAKHRLEVLEKFSDLGAGFSIANHDLELRGFGDLLGTAQKGQIQNIGLDMYTHLLEDAIAQGKGEQKLNIYPQINIPEKIDISNQYISDPEIRLNIYQRIANSLYDIQLVQLEEELAERFAKVPTETVNMIYQKRIYVLCVKLGIKLVEYRGVDVLFYFDSRSHIDQEKLNLLVSKEQYCTMPKNNTIAYKIQPHDRQAGMMIGVFHILNDLNERINRL